MERLQERSFWLVSYWPPIHACMQHFDEVLLARAFAKVSELDGRSRRRGNGQQAHAFEGVRQGRAARVPPWVLKVWM